MLTTCMVARSPPYRKRLGKVISIMRERLTAKMDTHTQSHTVTHACAHRKRLEKIISTMRERLTAKMGNSNNNGFKFRRLFQVSVVACLLCVCVCARARTSRPCDVITQKP